MAGPNVNNVNPAGPTISNPVTQTAALTDPSQLAKTVLYVLDANGNPIGLAGPNGTISLGAKGYIARVPQFIGGRKPLDNFEMADGGAFLRTSYLKVEAEAPFSAVRIWFSTWIATALGPYTALVAPTETMSKANTTLAFIPQVNGASQNTIAPAVWAAQVNPYGHRQVTWDGGATSFTLGSAGPTHANPVFKCSDIIPCRSVPRVDVTGVAANRHACMMRMFNSAGNRSNADIGGSGHYDDLGQPWFREYQGAIHLTNGTDGVTTPSNIPASVPGTTTNNVSYSHWIEFFYDSPTRHVINIGNSRQNNWPQQIVQYSTPAAPIAFTECTFPGDNIQVFMGAYDQMITAGLGDVTDVIVQGYDRNVQFSGRKIAEDMIWMYSQYIKKFRAAGARVFLTTDYCENSYNAEAELGRQRVLAWVREMCSQGMAILVDTDPLITDYTVPATPSMKAAFNSGDNVHANAAGELLMSAVMNAAWLANP